MFYLIVVIIIIIIADIPTPQAQESFDGMIEGPHGNIHLLFIRFYYNVIIFVKISSAFKCYELLRKTFVCLINTLKLFCHYKGLGLSHAIDNPSLWVICKNQKTGLRDGVASLPLHF